TAYADKLIKGPEVSKRGKKIVNIGAAVDVLTGRVEKVYTVTSRRPRRGPQNLLLESFDEGTQITSESEPIAEPIKTLLDDPADDIPDIPIDLSISLHIALQKEQQVQQEQEVVDPNKEILSDFDTLEDENDEFAELAAESLTKKDEVQHITNVDPVDSIEVSTDWAAFEEQKSEKAKPQRPPPPRPEAISQIVTAQLYLEDDDAFDNIGDDPFDTTFVEKVITEEDDDFDFDPRKDEIEKPEAIVLAPEELIKKPIDLLAGSSSDLTQLSIDVPIVPVIEQEREIDPFDTSAVIDIVQPKEIEIKFLEQELLSDTKLRQSLSDPDFDPRADEAAVEIRLKEEYENTARRKSSLSLNISGGGAQKSVVFALGADLLGSTNLGNGKIQKPLTPYYPGEIAEEIVNEDPFDTSFVPASNPTQVELNLIEKDLLTSLKPSLSDPDFDPRAFTPIEPTAKSDLLAVSEEHNFKVLTPATELPKQEEETSFIDPFDTSAVDHTILPGKAELKLIETELLPTINTEPRTTVLDSYSDSQELGLGGKVLTPQVPSAFDFEEERDPFDTSIANNLGPGKTEIKLLESELIHQ
ncbi:Protein stoned-A, partial [Pseudolycoriella hygida]